MIPRRYPLTAAVWCMLSSAGYTGAQEIRTEHADVSGKERAESSEAGEEGSGKDAEAGSGGTDEADGGVNSGAPPVHRWRAILYPEITSWRKDVRRPSLSIENKDSAGMEMTFHYSLPSDAEQKKQGKAAAETVKALLWRGRAAPAELKETFTELPNWGSGPPMEFREIGCTHTFTVPWGPNTMEDAWVALKMKGRTFWVALPYGFARDPAAPLPPAVPDAREPQLPVTEKELGPAPLLIPWETVSYDLEQMPRGKSATVRFANPFDFSTELSLSGYGGDVREPHAELTLMTAEGWDRAGRCVSLSIAEGTGSAQMFHYPRTPGDGRTWGEMIVKIGGTTRKITVPSSVFGYVQGFAEAPEGVETLKPADKWHSRM